MLVSLLRCLTPYIVIRKVILGDDDPERANMWPRSNAVLKALNISAGQRVDHQNHYHIAFRTPRRVEIGGDMPDPLMANELGDHVESGSTLIFDLLRDMSTDAALELGITENQMDMHYMETPDGRPAMVMVAAANSTGTTPEKALGVCLAMQRTPEYWTEREYREVISIAPNDAARRYFYLSEKRTLPLPAFQNVQIVKQPSHGRLTQWKDAADFDTFLYAPSPGYSGKDSFEAVVPVEGQAIRVVYVIHVQSQPTEKGSFNFRKFCPKTNWIISADPNADQLSSA